MREPDPGARGRPTDFLQRLRERGVLRVAASYAVIAWLVLQIASVVFDPLGVPKWGMAALIIALAAGFPIALALAWYLEVGERGVERDLARDGVSRPRARGLRHYADAIVIGVLLVAVVVLAVRQSDLAKPTPPANPTIAVLPFANVGGDPAQEYLSDGLAQEVLDRLGRVPGLTVIARASSFSFKGKDVDATTIAGRLAATTLLEGSVRRDGDRLKLSAELIDGATGRQLWSGTFDRRMTDVFKVQEELAMAVIEAIVPAARGQATAGGRAPTSDMSAYDLYLLGRQAQEARTGERFRDSVAYFERAIAADPKFAKAHAALSRSLVLWDSNPHVPTPADARQRAEAEAHAALAIDPDSSEAHAALATTLRDRDLAAAETEYKRALEINPNNVVALWDYGVALSQLPGREKDKQRVMDRVARLDPRSPILWAQRLDDATMRRDGGKLWRLEFDRALATFQDEPDALSLMGRAARMSGFAPEAYRVGRMLDRSNGTGPIHRAIARAGPWMLVDDYDRARGALDVSSLKAPGQGPRNQLIELAWREGDVVTVDRLVPALQRDFADDPRAWRRSALWLSLRERNADALQALTKAGALPDLQSVVHDGCMMDDAHMLVALLRIYRAAGRSDEADRIAQACLRLIRDDPGRPFDLAELAANEGLADEAIRALEDAFSRTPLVSAFHPSFPWFRSLEGHPSYDALLRNREKRIAQARAEMLRIDSSEAKAATPPRIVQ